MTDLDYVQLVKWIVIVLAAGFIGQFGRSLATYLMKKARRTKGDREPEASTVPTKAGPESAPPPRVAVPGQKELEGKVEKKASKALLKMKKKEAKQ